MKEASAIFVKEIRKSSSKYGACILPSKADQAAILEKHQLLPDSFFWVLDLRTTQLSNIHGVDRFLGLPDQTFVYAQLLERIHPAFRILFCAKALAIYLVMDQFKQFALPEAHFYYNVFLPLKLYDGNYYRVRQMSLPFCQDEKGNMVLQLNVYRTGLEPYEGQPMTSFFSSSNKKPLAEPTTWMKAAHIKSLHEKVFTKFPILNPLHKNNWGFSESEIKLLKVFSKQPNLKWETAAEMINLSKTHTSDLWSKQIKKRVNLLFKPRRFEKITDLVTFLKQMDVLR